MPEDGDKGWVENLEEWRGGICWVEELGIVSERAVRTKYVEFQEVYHLVRILLGGMLSSM